MKIIGFANEYFTLWNLTIVKKHHQDDFGVVHYIGDDYNYTYLQNLSKDENSAVEKAIKLTGQKDIEVDEGLRGISSRSFSKYVERSLHYSVFPFGKYKFCQISNCTDEFQLLRVYRGEGAIGGSYETKINQLKRRVIARKKLIELGLLIKFNGKYLTSREVEYEKINNANGHFFTEGLRVELILKEVSSLSFEGVYGDYYIVTYTSSEGNTFKYKGNTPPNITSNEYSRVKATIKHDSYKGVQETVLQRISLQSK